VAVSIGPGMYSSLRTGVSVAKGLCFALDIPLIAIDTLQALAWGMRAKYPSAAHYIPCIDARRGEVWTALFDRNLQIIKPAQPLVLDATRSELQAFAPLDSSGLVILGLPAKRTYFDEHTAVPTIEMIEIEHTSKNLCALAFEKMTQRLFENLAMLEVVYMKAPNITTAKNRLLALKE
jgi:tRNA threonylcarbamoyladenosine biosynthesis protein TsaB